MTVPPAIEPNFFIAGAPKCGTTALHTYLGEHPRIFMASEKESNHFATDLLPSGDPFRPDDRYYRMFEGAGGAAVVGESSVFYLLSKDAAANIRRRHPDARIVIMLRDPADMLPSYHAQLVYNHDEDVLDFEMALRAEDDRRAGRRPVREGLRFKERLYYSEVVSFAGQVERYLSRFPAERVRVILYDDLRRDAGLVYRETLAFLGLESDGRTEFPVINARKPLPSAEPRGRLARLRTLWPRLRGAAAAEPPDRRRAAVRAALRERFRPEVERLAAVIGRDLGAWLGDDRP